MKSVRDGRYAIRLKSSTDESVSGGAQSSTTTQQLKDKAHTHSDTVHEDSVVIVTLTTNRTIRLQSSLSHLVSEESVVTDSQQFVVKARLVTSCLKSL